MTDNLDTVPRDVIVVEMRTEEDWVLSRHAVMASHGRTGALIVVDVSRLEPWEGFDPCAEIGELARTAQGNGQRLVALGQPTALGWDRCSASADVPFYPELATCLRLEVPAEGKSYGLLVTLPARLDHVAPVKQHLSSVVRRQHGDAEGFQVEILVDELALNAVENSPSSRSSYDLRFVLENHELILEVTNDFDEAIDSTRIMNRRLQSFDDSGGYMGERGRGLFLIARIADGLQIRAVEGDRVRVTVTKRLRAS